MELVECNLCEANSYSIIHRNIDGTNSNLVLCKRCGLSYLNPRWSQDQYKAYYLDLYDSEYRPNSTDPIYSNHKSLPFDQFQLRWEALPNKGQTRNILDIGSGFGDLLIRIGDYLCCDELYAVESSRSALIALEEQRINVLSTEISNLSTKRKFDLIIMRHVLEHFLDPVGELARIKDLLSPDGMIYVVVPNNFNINRRKGWKRIAHTFYYNRHTLKGTIAKAGLEIVELKDNDSFGTQEIFAFAKNKSSEGVNFFMNDVSGVECYKEQRKCFRLAKTNEVKAKLKNLMVKILNRLKY